MYLLFGTKYFSVALSILNCQNICFNIIMNQKRFHMCNFSPELLNFSYGLSVSVFGSPPTPVSASLISEVKKPLYCNPI